MGFALSIRALNSDSSSSVKSTMEAPKFSSRRAACFVPGMGIAPCAMTHAKASWLEVVPFLAAQRSNSSTIRRFLGMFSTLKRGIVLLISSAAKSSGVRYLSSAYYSQKDTTPAQHDFIAESERQEEMCALELTGR